MSARSWGLVSSQTGGPVRSSGRRLLTGIDHAFGFPIPYFEHYGIKDWDHLLTISDPLADRRAAHLRGLRS